MVKSVKGKTKVPSRKRRRKGKGDRRLGEYLLLAVYVLVSLALLVEAYVYFNSAALYIRLIAYIGIPIALTLGVALFLFNKAALFKLIFSTMVMIEVTMIIYMIMEAAGLFDTLTDIEQIRRLILSTGGWGKLVFCLVQFFQVVVLPVPAFVFYLVGIALYGATTTFLLSMISVISGSLVCFWIGRLAGEKVVSWIVGREDAIKYRKFLGDKGRLALIVMLLFPFFPDDMLCMVAGLTTMSWLYFAVVVLITRTINIAVTCYFGSGAIIPFKGWGIGVWIAIAAVLITVFILFSKNQERIVTFMQGGSREIKRIERPSVYSLRNSPIISERVSRHENKDI